MKPLRQPIEREPVFDRLDRDVTEVGNEMAVILHRQNRWTRRDLHLAVGGFQRCSGAVAWLAISKLERDGVLGYDAPYGPDSIYLRAQK